MWYPFRRRRDQAFWAALLVTVFAVGCSALDERQRHWIFQPGDRTWQGGLAAAAQMQDVWVDYGSAVTEEPVRLHGLWSPHDDPQAPLLLVLHGARYDVRGSAHRMQRLQRLGFSVLGIDYRGFGRSSPGLPSEDMAYEDARAAWDWLAAQHPGRLRFVYGHSLGAAIAVDLASHADDVGGLIVEGGFTSIPDLVSSFKWGWLPVGPLITQRFDAAERIGRVQAPVLVVHGSDDELIPPSLGQALYERAGGPKRWVLVDGGSHHNAQMVGRAAVQEALVSLFGIVPPR
jgi:alpha-beta hydrolase superfamily lysophospholipase